MRSLALVALVAALLAIPAGGQPPVAPPPRPVLTPEIKELLRERNRLDKESLELERAGKTGAALTAAERALAHERAVYGDTHADVATSLSRIGRLRVRREDWAGARAAYHELVEVRAALYGAEEARVTDARLALADVDQVEKMTPADRADVHMARDLNADGVRLHGQSKFAAAESAFQDALALRKRVLGNTHPDTFKSLTNLGVLYWTMGRHADAEPLFKQALAGRQKILGATHPETYTSMSQLAVIYQDQARYAEAEPLYKAALAGCRKAMGATHPDTYARMANLAALYQDQARYAHAEPLLNEVLAGTKQALGAAHPETFKILNSLAVLYTLQGRYGDAEPLLKEALAGTRKALGDDDPLVLTFLHNLARLYKDQGRYVDAEPLLKEALAGRQKVLGDAHPETLRSLNNLAVLYQFQGRYGDVEALLKEALDRCTKALSETHPVTLMCAGNLGALYQDRGRYADAEPLLKRALAGRQKVLGDTHPDALRSAIDLAILYQVQGRYADAEPLFTAALAGYKKTLGATHRDTLMSLNALAFLYQSQRRFADAGRLVTEALAGTRSLLADAVTGQAEVHQLAYRAALRYQLDIFLSFGMDARTPVAERYAEVLAWKGSALARRAQLRAAIERSADPELKALFTEAADVSRRLANASSSTPPAPQLAAHRKTLTALTERKDALYQELDLKSEPFRAAREAAALTPARLAAALPAGAALVDYLEYSQWVPDPDQKGKYNYERWLLAYVVRNGTPVIEVELGAVAPITAAVDAWRDTLGRAAPARDDKDPAAILRQKVWEPVAKHLAGAKVVLVSPDGALGRLPFAALPGADPKNYLIEETALVVVPVPQLIPGFMSTKPAASKGPGLLLVGGVDYDAAPGAPAAGASARTAEGTGTRARGAAAWSALPATAVEAKAIRGTFAAQFPAGTVAALEGPGATEAAVRQKAPASRYVHIATHGFFAPPKPDTAPKAGPLGEPKGAGLDRRGAAEVHPGLQSGLVLAGANRPPTPGADDGILTALEVTDLDLSAVELAVLSACETRLGKEFAGEGALGLERALQAAGARSTVTTLWKVPDKATEVLMVRFYQNLWDKKMSKLDALREAQLWMLKEGAADPALTRGAKADDPDGTPVPKGGRLSPYYWAAFTLAGDWR